MNTLSWQPRFTKVTLIDHFFQLSCRTWFAEKKEKVSLKECVVFLRDLSQAQKSFFSEVCTLAHLILIMLAINAVSERSFSAMKCLKTYLRGTMCQSRRNHVMMLNINWEKLDQLDIDNIADQFVQGNEYRLRQPGKFSGRPWILSANNYAYFLNRACIRAVFDIIINFFVRNISSAVFVLVLALWIANTLHHKLHMLHTLQSDYSYSIT